MRVLVDTSYAGRGPSGTAVYVRCLVAALREQGVEVAEASQRRRLALGAGNPARSAANVVLDWLWLHVGLPRAARAAGADVVHHPLPAFSRRIGVPQAVTVHDVAFARLPRHYSGAWRRQALGAYRRAVRGAGAVICVSEATAREAISVLAADPTRVVVAHPGQLRLIFRIPRNPSPAPIRS